jgi:hypothetical protein
MRKNALDKLDENLDGQTPRPSPRGTGETGTIVFSHLVGQIERKLRIWSPLSKLFNLSHGVILRSNTPPARIYRIPETLAYKLYYRAPSRYPSPRFKTAFRYTIGPNWGFKNDGCPNRWLSFLLPDSPPKIDLQCQQASRACTFRTSDFDISAK